MHWLTAALVLLTVLLQSQLWRGDGGLLELQRLRVQVASMREEIAALQTRNNALAAEVADLKTGDQAVEERARVELGMIRRGEIFLQLIETDPNDPAPSTR